VSKETEEQSSICIPVIVGKDIGGSTRFGQNKTGSSSMIGFAFSFVLGIDVSKAPLELKSAFTS